LQRKHCLRLKKTYDIVSAPSPEKGMS